MSTVYSRDPPDVEDKGFLEKETMITSLGDKPCYMIAHVRDAMDVGGGDAILKTFQPDPFVVISLDG